MVDSPGCRTNKLSIIHHEPLERHKLCFLTSATLVFVHLASKQQKTSNAKNENTTPTNYKKEQRTQQNLFKTNMTKRNKPTNQPTNQSHSKQTKKGQRKWTPRNKPAQLLGPPRIRQSSEADRRQRRGGWSAAGGVWLFWLRRDLLWLVFIVVIHHNVVSCFMSKFLLFVVFCLFGCLLPCLVA